MRILSFADLHLDSPFSGYPENEKAERREILNRVFCKICALCRAFSADVLLIGGDLFDVPDPLLQTEELVVSELNALDCKVYIAPGNHDYYKIGGIFDRMPENVFVFKDAELTTVVDQGLGLAIDGYAFTSESYMNSPLDKYKRIEGNHTRILLAHTDLSSTSSSYASFSPAALEQTDYVFAALGHVHTNTEAMRFGKCTAAYSGVVQGRSIDEPVNGGVRLTVIENGEITENTLIDVSEWKNMIFETAVDSAASDAEIIRRIVSELSVCSLEKYDVARIILVGEHDFYYTPNTEYILAAVGEAYPGVTFSIKNNSNAKIDRETMMGDPSIVGVLYRTLFENAEFSDQYDEETRIRAFRLALSAIRGDNINPENI